MRLFGILCNLVIGVAASANLYGTNSQVLKVDASNYDELISMSNHVSIVEFYAPWCGHCQSLKPKYEKVAKSLHGLANVAAVNCDEEYNKALCGRMGVRGFPTLKIIYHNFKLLKTEKESRKTKPEIEDYQGPRSAKAIVDAVINRVPTHVAKITSNGLDAWLTDNKHVIKAIMFSENSKPTTALRALAIDFLDIISFAQIQSSEAAAVKKFGVEKFPTLMLLSGEDSMPVIYDGEMKKESVAEFLRHGAEFNRAAASASNSESLSHSAPVKDPAGDPSQLIMNPATVLETPQSLQQSCLTTKSHPCILVILPDEYSLDSRSHAALHSLGALAARYEVRGRATRVFGVKEDNDALAILRELGTWNSVMAVLFVMGRSGNMAIFQPDSQDESFNIHALERWIEGVRLGDIKRAVIPAGVLTEVDEIKDTREPTVLEGNKHDSIRIELEEVTDDFASHDEL